MKMITMTLTIFRGIVCPQIYVYQSLFHSNKYLNKERIQLKRAMGLSGWTDDHHLIPKSLAQHPVLYDIDINNCKNLKIMPNVNANVNSNVRIHCSHIAYNRYVKSLLDTIPMQCDENRKYQIYLLLNHLDSNLHYVGDIPF